MTQLPVEPYWINAGWWWIVNRNENVDEYHAWLREQGVVVTNRNEYFPWIEFENEEDATMFMLRWA